MQYRGHHLSTVTHHDVLTNNLLCVWLKKMKSSVTLTGGEAPSRVGPTILSLVSNPYG